MSQPTRKINEQKPGYLSPEFITQRAQFYVDRSGKKVFIGCGDDRNATAASTQVLTEQAPNAMPVSEGYASIFGALAGIAKAALITGISQYGSEFIQRVGGFAGALQKAAAGMQADESSEAIIPALHSAEKNEGNTAKFSPDSSEEPGCKHATSLGAASALLVSETDPSIRDAAREYQIYTFGNDDHVDELLKAHDVMLKMATHGKGKDFALSREDYLAADLPVMILAGGHTSAKKSGLINNFNLHSVRNSTAANAAGKDFYNQDISIMTVTTLRAFKKYDIDLDPELLMRAFVLEAVPVQAVLAAGDTDPDLHGKLNARNLPMGVLGDPQEALATLRTI